MIRWLTIVFTPIFFLYANANMYDAFDALDPTNKTDRFPYLQFSSETKLAQRYDFIHAHWQELSSFVHPIKQEHVDHEDTFSAATQTHNGERFGLEKQSTLKITAPLSSFLSLKKNIHEKSKILLYAHNNFIASTGIQGSSGDFHELSCFLNKLALPWATRGNMRFCYGTTWGKTLPRPYHGTVSATAFCDNIMIAAIIEETRTERDFFSSTMLHIGSLDSVDDIEKRAFGRNSIPTSPNTPRKFSLPTTDIQNSFIQPSGLVTALFMPTTNTVYVGNHAGWIRLYNLRRYNEYGEHLGGAWTLPLLELRTSELEITAIAGDDDGSECIWIEKHTRVAAWSQDRQKISYLSHKYLPRHNEDEYVITSLDRHPTLPLYVFATSAGRVIIYDAKAECFYPPHNGFLAGFDTDGYLIILEKQQSGEVIVKRYAFTNLFSYSMLQLALLAKMKQKEYSITQLKEPWRGVLESLPKHDKIRLKKHKK